MRKMLLALAVALALPLTLGSPKDAYGYASYAPGYGDLAYEGVWPNHTDCSFGAVESGYLDNGVLLQHMYSPVCGSYGKISNAYPGCFVRMDRYALGYEPTYVRESVDSGDTFAYTMLVNNLYGRLAQASASCGGSYLQLAAF